MVGRGKPPLVDEPTVDILDWGEGDRGRGTAGEDKSGVAYLGMNRQYL